MGTAPSQHPPPSTRFPSGPKPMSPSPLDPTAGPPTSPHSLSPTRQSSSPSHSPPPSPPNTTASTSPEMTTQARHNIFKPKPIFNLHTKAISPIPENPKLALHDPNRNAAMFEELDALTTSCLY